MLSQTKRWNQDAGSRSERPAAGRPPALSHEGNTQGRLSGNSEQEAMMQDLDQAIRERAYQLWIESGRDDGKADAHWLEAQREILSASLGELGRSTSSEAKK